MSYLSDAEWHVLQMRFEQALKSEDLLVGLGHLRQQVSDRLSTLYDGISAHRLRIVVL